MIPEHVLHKPIILPNLSYFSQPGFSAKFGEGLPTSHNRQKIDDPDGGVADPNKPKNFILARPKVSVTLSHNQATTTD